MYLGRTKKKIEQQDELDFKEKTTLSAERKEREETSNSDGVDFKTDELPDGACFRPRSVNVDAEDGQTAVRPAEYIGSFSVSGENQQTRAEFVTSQLETMRVVTKSKKVMLVITLSGIKVCSSSGDSVYMAHALKRISYAACDPEHCQFAFLAREPKGHIKVQFCHTFITETPEQAEELNTIISNAFKMAYAQQKKHQPTFNELIEQQLVEQKARFQEYQEQANRVLQQRLTEIATPTAIKRMELRRQSSSDELSGSSSPSTEKEYNMGKNKIWAKHATEKVQHRSPALDSPGRSESPTFSSQRPTSYTPQSTRISDPSFSSSKRNSTPIQLSSPSKNTNTSATTSSPIKRLSSPHASSLHNFQVVTIRESLENNVNGATRFKGSPVTALKDEIDRRFSTGGMGTIDSGLGFSDDCDTFNRQNIDHHYDNEDTLNKSPMSTPLKMLNRPLPAIPPIPEPTPDHRASPRLRNWTSLDDDVIPHHSRSTLQARMRDSPKRRPQRPQSEVILDTKLYIHGASNNNNNIAADQPGVYIYGCKAHTQTQLSQQSDGSHFSQSSTFVSNFSSASNKSPQSHLLQRLSPSCSPKGSNSSVPSSPKAGSQGGYDNMMQNGKSSPLHFQNGGPPSPRQLGMEGGDEDAPKTKEKGGGLESLMGLDRSHIEDETLRHASWYQAGIPRDVALEILQQEDIGSFIVRDSSTHPGCYALSVRVPKFENPSGISHYLILKTQRGVKLKGLDKEWSSLLSLVTHHTVMPEMLPCTLRLPRDSKNPTFNGSDKDEKEEDPDYQRLADFSSMMEALKQ